MTGDSMERPAQAEGLEPVGAAIPPPPPVPNAPAVGESAPKKRWTGGKIALLVVGVSLLVVGGFLALVAVFIWGSQEVVDQAVPRDALIGECFDRHDSSREPVPCDSPHTYEVYAYIEFYPGYPYPSGLERLGGSEVCIEEFEVYTGEDYWTSSLDYSIPYPTEEEWEAGDLVTVCALHHSELRPITGSRKR